MPAIFAYLRVSTTKQGESGLGLEAQREAVARYSAFAGVTVEGECVEIESGKNDDRPELARAIAACRKAGARLVIAKLDRLARSVKFIANFMDSGVDFVACDMPHADRFRLHIEAAIAEDEARKISERTKSALAAAKARCVKLGNPNGRPFTAAELARATAVRMEAAEAFCDSLKPIMEGMRGMSLGATAKALNARGIKTSRGGAWAPIQVARVLGRTA